MYCEKYKCSMSVAACLARYKKMVKPGPVNYQRDPGCVSCEMGKKLMQKYKRGELIVEEQKKSCTKCDLVVPMSEAEKHFFKSKQCKDGFEGMCKICKRETAKAKRRAKRAAEQKKVVKKAPAAVPPDPAVEELVTRMERRTVTLDFTGRADLLDAIEALADSKFRTLELQIMAMVAGVD